MARDVSSIDADLSFYHVTIKNIQSRSIFLDLQYYVIYVIYKIVIFELLKLNVTLCNKTKLYAKGEILRLYRGYSPIELSKIVHARNNYDLRPKLLHTSYQSKKEPIM